MEAGHTSRHSRLLTGLIVIAAVLVLGIGLAIHVEGLHFQTVLSGSMRPTLSPGDVAVTQAVPTSSLRVGDVIVFVPPTASEAVIHRISSLRNGVMTTKGDANTVSDPWHVTLAGATAYRMVGVLPFLGWLVRLQQPALLLAGLLVGLGILLELWKEVRARSTKPQPEPQP
jgi:signal peptidase I